MDETAKAAYIMSQVACMNAEVSGMVAENQCRLQRGEAVAYTEDSFVALIDHYGLSHNAVLIMLQGE